MALQLTWFADAEYETVPDEYPYPLVMMAVLTGSVPGWPV